jgi:hypothetical protein
MRLKTDNFQQSLGKGTKCDSGVRYKVYSTEDMHTKNLMDMINSET